MELVDLLAPHSLDEFLATCWSQRPLHVPGRQEKFATLVPWRDLNTVLSQHRLEPPRLRVEKFGAPASELTFIRYPESRKGIRVGRIDVDLLYRRLRDGATLILDAIDEVLPPVTSVAEGLTRVFGVPVQINMYAAWGRVQGFPLHWDDHDTIILQVHGRKHWKIFGQTRVAPVYRDVVPNDVRPTTPVQEMTLSPGDFLYVPRGWWHEVCALDEPSLHLTCGITNKTGIDLFSWLADLSRENEVFRRDLPKFGSATDRKAYVAHLRSWLESQLDDQLLDRYFADVVASVGARPRTSLPDAVAADPFHRKGAVVRFAGTTYVRSNGAAGRSFTVRTLGTDWDFAVEAAGPVDLLLTGKALTLEELERAAGSTDPSDLRALLAELLAQGFITVA